MLKTPLPVLCFDSTEKSLKAIIDYLVALRHEIEVWLSSRNIDCGTW